MSKNETSSIRLSFSFDLGLASVSDFLAVNGEAVESDRGEVTELLRDWDGRNAVFKANL